MAEEIKRIEAHININLDKGAVTSTELSADNLIGLSDYPDYQPIRRGMVLVLDQSVIDSIVAAAKPQAEETVVKIQEARAAKLTEVVVDAKPVI